MEEELNVQELHQLVDDNVVGEIKSYIEEHNIVDLAEQIEQLDYHDILYIFKAIPNDIAAEIFTYFSSEKQEEIINAFTGPQIVSLLDNVYFDDAVDIIRELPANMAKKVLASATKEQRETINQLLSYAEGTAGSIMNVDFVELKTKDSVETAIEKIKSMDSVAETVNNCYVVDATRTLKGTVELYDLMFADADKLVEDIMDIDCVSVKTSDDQEEVAEIFRKYDITVVPVVNNEDKLIGIITDDDILDVVEEETTEDILHMSGVGDIKESYIEASVMDIVKSRLPWLLVLMVSATFTGMLISSFEDKLAVLPALTTFIPMLMDTGGNAGGQASTMIIRAISVDGINLKDVARVLWKEFRISFICGLILMAVNVARVMILTPDYGFSVALVMSVTLLLTVIVAKCIGGLLPLLAAAVNLDPASVVAPLITTISDAISLIIYLNLATNFLNL